MELPPSASAAFGSLFQLSPSEAGRAGISVPVDPVISITSLYPRSNPVRFFSTIFSGKIADKFAFSSLRIFFASISKILVNAPIVATFGTFRPTVSRAMRVAGT